jgi:hypothetical protein
MSLFLEDFLDFFGVRFEKIHTPDLPPGMLEKAEGMSAIGRRFASDAARQQAGSFYFSGDTRISSYMTGPGGVRLPRFTMPEWARKC